MEAFATIEDLENGWRQLDESEEAKASELLLRATAFLYMQGVRRDEDNEAQAIVLKGVTCDLVRRVFPAGSGGMDGIASMQQSIGDTSANVSFATRDGGFYLYPQERSALGLTASGKGRILRPATAEL